MKADSPTPTLTPELADETSMTSLSRPTLSPSLQALGSLLI
jgi:hypothetical protein